ncbi:CDP-glycerol glycerophosphotransferase family protein [Psychrilyobacter sp.]|uniref:CDP-glycerol glycerophosphotransferase family protein n=1 Tax=Psychrilyobacter sp. TaxID=2586924 RepID=UPI00301A0BED
MKKLISDILNLIFSCFKLIIAYFVKDFIIKDDEIYLIGSNYGSKRSDNAIALYNYIKFLEMEVYFIENNPKDGNSLKRGSFKSFVYYFKSNGVFYSHSFSDILPGMHKAGRIMKYFGGPKKVFIQHGIIGFKEIDNYIRSLNDTMDYFLVSSVFERDIVKEVGIVEEKIKVLGLPRYDLLPKSFENSEEILIFLSWQNNERYIKKLNEIIEVFKNSRYKLKIAVHDMVKEELKIPENYLVSDIGKAVRESVMLITDDSSVAWDFFYNGREVIFYKSEEKWYVDDEFFKCRKVETENELKKHLEKIRDKKLEVKVPNDLFQYRDRKNSERVFDVLQK